MDWNQSRTLAARAEARDWRLGAFSLYLPCSRAPLPLSFLLCAALSPLSLLLLAMVTTEGRWALPRLLYNRILSGDTLYSSLYVDTRRRGGVYAYSTLCFCCRKMRLRDGRWASQRNVFFFNRLKMWRVRFLADEVDLDLFVVSSSEISLSPPFWDRRMMDG